MHRQHQRGNLQPQIRNRFNQLQPVRIFERNIHEDHIRRQRLDLIELAATPFNIVGQPSEIKFNPKSAVDGQFSAPYSVAIACIEKKAFLEEYTDECVRRPDVRECMEKIEIKHTPELDRYFPESFPTKITVTTEDGETFTREVRYPKGDPENPLSWDEMIQKFERCMVNVHMEPGNQNRIIESLRNLENAGDIKEVTALLS